MSDGESQAPGTAYLSCEACGHEYHDPGPAPEQCPYCDAWAPCISTQEVIRLSTDKWRIKRGRLQRGFTSRPWVNGFDDPTYLHWIDVPLAPDDAPDDEVLK